MAERKPDSGPTADHWLVRPENIRKLWIIFIAVLALTVLADLFVEHHPHFGLDGTFGFGAWFGFISCVVLVFFSKALGAILKRPDTYYPDGAGPADGDTTARTTSRATAKTGAKMTGGLP